MVLANPNHVSYPFSIPAVPCARIQPVLTGAGADCLYWCKWGSFKIQARSIFCTYTLRSVHVTFLWCAVLRCNARCTVLQYNPLTGHMLMCNDLALHVTFFWCAVLRCNARCAVLQYNQLTGHSLMCNDLALHVTFILSAVLRCNARCAVLQYNPLTGHSLPCNDLALHIIYLLMRSSAIQFTDWTFAPVQWPCLAIELERWKVMQGKFIIKFNYYCYYILLFLTPHHTPHLHCWLLLLTDLEHHTGHYLHIHSLDTSQAHCRLLLFD